MARDPRHDILFEPIQIGPKTLRNRFYQVPHCTGFGNAKPFSQAHHRAMKAEGGWAAVCTEYAAVSPDADEAPFAHVRVWDDGDMAHIGVTAEQAHAAGALAGIELFHSGVHGHNADSRLPSIGPSQIAGDYNGFIPRAMTKADIRRVQADWVKAAERSRDAGFDIVYAYGAHTYLPGQFLSPFYNQRTDEYGGSLVNRARFWVELLEQLDDAVGRDCAIAARIAVDPGGAAAGVPLEESLEFIRLADRHVHLWDVNIGSISEWSVDSGVSRFFAAGWQLEWTGQVRRATERPIVGVGRLTNADQMAEIVRSGVWDIIGAARPSIADPFLPQQDRRGPAGRDPRVHRLQPVHRQGRLERPHRLHAERDRRRGVPPRLASGAVRARRERRQGRARRGRRAGRPGVRDRAREARVRARPRRHGRQPRSAASCAGCRGCPGSASGAACSTGGGSSCRSCGGRSS